MDPTFRATSAWAFLLKMATGARPMPLWFSLA